MSCQLRPILRIGFAYLSLLYCHRSLSANTTGTQEEAGAVVFYTCAVGGSGRVCTWRTTLPVMIFDTLNHPTSKLK